MLIQYEDAGTISNTYLDVFYSKIGVLDRYVICQIGEGRWGCLIYRIPSKECIQYTITRTGSNYGGYSYSLTEQNSDWEYSISNEIYCYSNIGLGKMAILPCHEIMTSWGVTALTTVVMLAVVFKGALFKCLRRKNS